ncbi:uncharacterized protein LOC111412741 [Olea europaea var. sylvestris]|uniref:uncharacterized protein LOC111412741 n=1 Tax=Olea europaea var. sylvestris TaxID=158386 RepID=UPI000C1CF00F|nr:uncharacterized protein LOC111412741 [Olea europaea var. sylvestris]
MPWGDVKRKGAFTITSKRNTGRNFIATIIKEDGIYTTSQNQVAQKFILFYRNLLGTSCPVHPIKLDILRNGPLVSLEQGNSLTRDISSQEIKEALFGIRDDKSPRPDGHTSYFFKKSWGIIGDDVVEDIKEFFSSRSLLKQINHTIITLVPKSNHTSNVEDYSPISCCNEIYNVISKILSSRWRPILETIVDPAQAAFIEGRSMAENIHLAQELMRQLIERELFRDVF